MSEGESYAAQTSSSPWPRHEQTLMHRWWMKLFLWCIVPATVGITAGQLVHLLPTTTPKIFLVFLEEAAHFLVVVAWIGAGVTMGAHAMHEIMETVTPSVTRDLSGAIRSIGRDVLNAAKTKMVPEFGAAMSSAIRDLGPVLAECISRKEFFPAELLRASLQQPEPIASTGHPQVMKAKELFEAGKPNEAVATLEPIADDPKVRPELLKMLIYSSNEDHWKRAGALLDDESPFEYSALLGYKYWTVRKVHNAINYGDRALKRAVADADALKIARAQNNLAYYLADAGERAEEARELASAAMRSIEDQLKKKEPGVDEGLVGRFATTIGLVHIVFARTEAEWEAGVQQCTDGLRRGADPELFLSHMDRARAKLAELRRTTTE